jgi:hypothetical protein
MCKAGRASTKSVNVRDVGGQLVIFDINCPSANLTWRNDHRNGQSFLLHVWDSLDCKPQVGLEEYSQGECGPTVTLLQYLTHKTKIARKGLSNYIDWRDGVVNL